MHIAHQNDAKSLFMKTVALDFAKKIKRNLFSSPQFEVYFAKIKKKKLYYSILLK